MSEQEKTASIPEAPLEKKPISQVQFTFIIIAAAIVGVLSGAGFFSLSHKDSSKNSSAVYSKKFVNPTVNVLPRDVTPKPRARPTYETQIFSLDTKGATDIHLTTNGVYGNGPLPPKLDGDGNMYSLINDKTIVKQNVESTDTQTVYEETSGNIISDFTITPSYLYLTEDIKNDESMTAPETIKEINLETKQVRSIGPLKRSIYSGFKYLFKLGNTDILGEFGGDGCGGWSTIVRYTNQAEEILKGGSGCSADPHYLGFREDKGDVLSISIIPNSLQNDISLGKLDTLFSTQLSDGSREDIYDLKTLNDTFLSYFLSDDKKTVGVVSKSKIYLINLDTKALTTIPNPSTDDMYSAFVMSGTSIFRTDYNNKKFVIIDPSTQAVVTLPWQSTIATNGSEQPTYLGTWNGKTYFYYFLVNY